MARALGGESFEGLGDVSKALKAVDREAVKELKLELRTAAKIVVDEARRRAPVNSGRLRRYIRASVRGSGVNFRAEVRASATAPRPKNPYSHNGEHRRGQVAVGIKRRSYPIPYPYPMRVEFQGGTPFPGGRGKAPGPRAFLWPALDDKRDEVRARADAGMARVIRKWTGDA